jgi:hypothetical protein
MNKEGKCYDLLIGNWKNPDDPTLVRATSEIEIGKMYFASAVEHFSFACIFVQRDPKFILDPNLSLYPKAQRNTTLDEIKKYTQSVIDLHFKEEAQIFSKENKIWFLEPYQPFMVISKTKTMLEILTEDFKGYFKYSGLLPDKVSIVEYNNITANLVKQHKKNYDLL